MTANASEICFGLVILLEAAEYHESANLATPPCRKKRDTATSSPTSPPARPSKPAKSGAASFSIPPMKRIKLDFVDISDGVWLRSNPRSSSSAIKISPINRPRKCSGGNAHRTWERADECAAAVASSRGFEFFNVRDGVTAGSGEANETLALCNKDDDSPTKTVRNIAKGIVAGAGEEDYSRLKTSRGVPFGSKQCWGSSTLSRGLCKGEKGATLPPKKQKDELLSLL